MLAARTGSVDAVKTLVRAGANVNAKETWNGQTALMWAAAEGHGAGRAGAARRRSRRPRAVQCRDDAAAVRRAQGRHGERQGDPGGRRRREREAARSRHAPCWSRSSTGTKISSTSCSTRAPIRTPKGGSTELTVQGMRARAQKIELKTPSFREQLRDVGTEGGNGRNNSWGRPLQAAVHVANWHISDEFISVEHRPDAGDQVAARARRRHQRPEHRHGAAVVGCAISPATGRARRRFCSPRRSPTSR